MGLNLLNTIPAEIHYLIFDSLNILDIERTVKVTGVAPDEKYYEQRHKNAFVAALKEIESIKHSIEIVIKHSHVFHQSLLVLGDYTTQYQLYLPEHYSPITYELTSKSNKITPRGSDHKKYTRAVKYRACKFLLLRDTFQFMSVDTDGIEYAHMCIGSKRVYLRN